MNKSQRRYSVAWVDPEFHKILKVRSAEEDLSIVDFTRKWALSEKQKVQENYSRPQDNQRPVVRRKWNFEL